MMWHLACRRGARHPALMGYESMLQPVSLTAETRSASLNRHPATRRLFFEPDAPVQLGPEQLPTTALQLQVKPHCHMQALVIMKWGSSAVSCAPPTPGSCSRMRLSLPVSRGLHLILDGIGAAERQSGI